MAKILLAGDVGATKTLLALYRAEQRSAADGGPKTRYTSHDYPGLEQVCAEFLGDGTASMRRLSACRRRNRWRGYPVSSWKLDEKKSQPRSAALACGSLIILRRPRWASLISRPRTAK